MRHIDCCQTWTFNILKEQMATRNPEWRNNHELKLTLCHMTKDVKTRSIVIEDRSRRRRVLACMFRDHEHETVHAIKVYMRSINIT